MLKIIMVCLILNLSISGCASYSELKKSSANHSKAGKYYESIGQPQVANEEHELAQRDRKKALKPEAIIQEIINAKAGESNKK